MEEIKHNYSRFFWFGCFLFLLAALVACSAQESSITPIPLPTNTQVPPAPISPTPTAIHRSPLSADEVKTIAAEFENIARANADAWDKGDLEPMYQVYAPDIMYYDSSPTEHFIRGADILIPFMTDYPIKNLPNMEVRLADTYIGRGTGVDVWEYRGTYDFPVAGYNLYTIREGRIAEWWGYMSSAAAAADGTPFSDLLLQDYADAWSSGEPEAVASLYDPGIVRQDTLFGENQQGSTAVKEFATNYFAWYPGVRLELQDSFQWSARDLGGLYSIHVSDQAGNSCDVRAIILLESSQDKIINEKLFYNADSLIACGWAE